MLACAVYATVSRSPARKMVFFFFSVSMTLETPTGFSLPYRFFSRTCLSPPRFLFVDDTLQVRCRWLRAHSLPGSSPWPFFHPVTFLNLLTFILPFFGLWHADPQQLREAAVLFVSCPRGVRLCWFFFCFSGSVADSFWALYRGGGRGGPVVTVCFGGDPGRCFT